VVGAGLSGAVVARELALKGKKVLVIDKRDHVAGNCYDFVDKDSGFRVAEYGALSSEGANLRGAALPELALTLQR
jgi:UDP-galactopyranose mutase